MPLSRSTRGAYQPAASGRIGASALYLNSPLDCVNTPYSAITDGLAAITIECWFYCTGLAGSQRLLCGRDFDNVCNLVLDPGANQLGFVTLNSASVSVTTLSASPVPLYRWVHLAGVWDGATQTTYLHGVAGTPLARTGVLPSLARGPSLPLILNSAMGQVFNIGDGYAATGVIQEVRLSNTARYSANFIPAPAPFMKDAQTLLLYHFAEGDGLTIYDAGPNALHGTILQEPVPQWTRGRF